ncbi:MAG: hypothetical protein L0207_04125 [Chlamydiae bacterium]|nr:hypothetical protein [Chlamydiota bacterium]
MRYCKPIINSILLFTIPAVPLYPQTEPPQIEQSPTEKLLTSLSDRLPSYDDVLKLLDEIESGEAEEKYTPEELERITQFIVFLAREGLLPGDDVQELENDTHDLLYGEDGNGSYEFFYSLNQGSDYIIVPAVFDSVGKIILCKGWLKKKFDKIKGYVKRHKKAIIIGAAIVVATAVVIGVAAAATAGAAGVAGAASSPGHDKKEKPTPEEKTPVPVDIPSTNTTMKETPVLKETINEQVSSFKEFMGEDKFVQQSTSSREWNDFSFGEKTRELGAFLAHKAFDEVSTLAGLVPKLYEELQGVGAQVIPEGLSLPNDISESSKENFENLVAGGHKIIDQVFSSDQAQFYDPEIKANDLMNNFAIGVIPLPGALSQIFSNTSKLIENGKVLDRAGFTKAGRSLMKHGYRDGSVFPKPVGNPAQVNEHGQKMLESILGHPEKKLIPGEFERFGKVVDIYAPGIGGARYSADGEFIGFLEP